MSLPITGQTFDSPVAVEDDANNDPDGSILDFGDAEAPADDPDFDLSEPPETAAEELEKSPGTIVDDVTTETQSLPVPLSQKDRIEMGQELADACQRFDSLTDEKKAFAARIKEDIDTQRKLRKSLSDALIKGTQNMDIEVERRVNRSGEIPTVEQTRLDTNEIIFAGPLDDLV